MSYGLKLQPDNSICYKEWFPFAKSISIFGDFNNWNREEFYAENNGFGCFELKLEPDING